MGCTPSNTDYILEANSIIVRNIKQTDKEILAEAIENNDALAMALIMQEIQAYPNSQISQKKKGWILTHLCCRWDSDTCLQYLLRHYFAENPKGYINFVNCQTSEGFTCLHLCSMWKSSKCFTVLHNFGGLDFTLKDNKLKTAYESSVEYKCPQIAIVLKEYKDICVEFKEVQIDKISTGPLIQLDFENPITLMAQRKTIEISNKIQQKLIEEFQFQTKKQQLFAEKKQVEEELEKLLQTKLRFSLDYDQKRKSIFKDFDLTDIDEVDREQLEKVERQKLDKQFQSEGKHLQQQIEEKEENLKYILQKMRQSEKDKRKAIKNQHQLKVQAEIGNLHIGLTKVLLDNQTFLMKQKTHRSSFPSRGTKTFRKLQNSQQLKKLITQCPPDIIKLYEEAKTAGFFFDKEFPAQKCSIGDPSKVNYENFTTNTVWLRPRQIFRSDFKLFDGIDQDDIKQGSLGVCYMLATLSALAVNPQNILKMFVFHDLDIGFYVIKLFVNGIPKHFVIDDLIPCCKTTKSPLFTQPIGQQIWVLLLEKAWAKLVGDYLSAQSMTADHIMQDLSGAPGYGWWLSKDNLKTPTQKIKEIIQHSELGHIVVLTSVQDHKVEGIVNNHSYTLLNVFKYKQRFVFKMRNPWGCFQWNGQFGSNSSLCTAEFKKKVGYIDKDDGIFFISQSELLKGFCFYSISHIKSQYHYSYIEFSSKKNQNIYFKFHLKNAGELNIRVTQPFDRLMKDKNYKYSPLILEIGRIDPSGEVQFVSEGHQRTFFGAKSVHAFQDILQHLQAGDYFVRIRMLWVDENKYNSAVLGFYASEVVEIKFLAEQEGIKMLKSLFLSFTKNGKKNRTNNGFYKISTMKGQFVFVAQTQEEGEFKATFKFNKQKMIRTEMDLGKSGPDELTTTINKLKCGIATAMRTQPALGGTTGSTIITFLQV